MMLAGAANPNVVGWVEQNHPQGIYCELLLSAQPGIAREALFPMAKRDT